MACSQKQPPLRKPRNAVDLQSGGQGALSWCKDLTVRITDVRDVTQPIGSNIRNAFIDFSSMTTSLVAVVTELAA